MKTNRVAAIALRQFYLLRGSPVRIVPLFAWVTIDIVLWGFITRYLNTVAAPGFNFVPALLGAVLLWDFLGRAMMGVTTGFFEDVWSRNFLNIFASPLLIPEYVGGLVISSMATSAFALAAMLALATTVFGLPFFAYGMPFAAALLILFVFGVALGVFGCALVLWLGPASEWLIWPIPALISPFACVFYPLASLPEWMRWVARMLPASWVFESMRRVVAGGAPERGAMMLGGGLAVLDVVIAGWFFVRVYDYAVRSGLIARYSAESVS